ncbi:MAG: helix-turn-helix domain-containing protein [Candidatus Omnitrophica bacterium]|nr:helix-turn-helix domain-containing protein [Candidatus Omnitrophota bacterium]
MERLMTAKQVSELIEVKPSTVYQWVHLGLIPHVKLGKCVRFKKDELFRWIDKNHRKERVSFKSVERAMHKKAPLQKEFFES